MIGIRSRKKNCVSASLCAQMLAEDFFHSRAFVNAHQSAGPLGVFCINHRHCNDGNTEVRQKRGGKTLGGGRFADDPG